MKYALVKDGRVVNAIELDDPAKWPCPAGHSLVRSDEASPGMLYDGKEFTWPEPVAKTRPQSEVEQLKALLVEKGVITEDDLTAAAQSKAT